jgi:predicted RNA binding protein YcfA (HicA-like mRNA interferase family)
LPVSRDELLRRLRNLGFVGPVSGGKHPYMIRGSHRLTVPNVHGSKEIDDALLRRILRQAGISMEEFDQARG